MARDTIIVLSHLRWNFVYQRPQQLMSRCARSHTVVFFEEPVFDASEATLELTKTAEGVTLAVPHLPVGTARDAAEAAQHKMIDHMLYRLDQPRPVLWYYTPMAVAFTHHVSARAVVYDCMDELSLFHGAPPELAAREALLLSAADVVFTGGRSLYDYKRERSGHKNIHAFPSSVDVSHFAQARDGLADPSDQVDLPHPRIGFFGVIDERLDLALLDELAEARPDLQLVMIGPVVKIDPASLPRRPNLHWLGGKPYAELPSYLAGWDAAMLPFARNDSTRFISPTKTPEYLAAGMPVVATSITDVVEPYGQEGLALIADSATDFAVAIDRALASERVARLAHVDLFLADMSWDRTWSEMWSQVERAIRTRAAQSRAAQPRATQRSIAVQRTGSGGAHGAHYLPQKA